MRFAILFAVGISALGCKDKEPAKAADPKSPTPAQPGPGSAAPTPPSGGAPPVPTLPADELFQAEERDAAWAGMAEKSIDAVAPHLEDVTCKKMQCRAVLVAKDEAEMMLAADKLQDESSLRGIDGAQAVILSQPVAKDGKLAMTIYLRFNRE